MKNIYKRISATIIAIALTIMLLPMSENAKVFADPINWIDSADITWYNSTDTTFSINTPEQLAGLAKRVNNGNNFSGKTIELTADIVLNNTTGWETWGTTPPANAWTAIGCETFQNKYFSGTFDGKGHTVSGIYFNNTEAVTANCYQGLFGLSNGTIKNVGVINSYIKGCNHIGGIVGLNNGGRVENCYNEGTIIGSADIGGVAGENYDGKISNCYNTGAVSGDNNVVGTTRIGGVVGRILGNEISNCYNTGAVSGNDYVGGVAGNIGGGTISNCYYYGFNAGIGGDGASQAGTTPFVKIANNPLGTGKTTTITEQTTTDINTAWSTALGSDFAVAFSDTYSSSDTGVATILGTTISGVSAGNSTISGRTMSITQNELASSGFTGGTKTISVPISMPLTVIALVDAVSPTFDTDLSGSTTYNKDDIATALEVLATTSDGGTVSYQWYKNTTNSTVGGTAISGATNATYTPPTDTAVTSYYYVIATNTNNSATGTKTATTTSGVKTIVVNKAIIPLTILNQPQGVTVNIGETASLTVTASGSGTLSYQWYSNTISSSIGGTEITGATTSIYSAHTTSAGTTYYYCVVTDMDTSNTVTTLAVKVEVISNLNPSTPTNPSSPSTPSSSSNSSKTIKVIETPTGIENSQLIGVTASDNAFNESVEVRLKNDATTKQAIEQALTEEFADILKEITIFTLDISVYIKGTNTKVQPSPGTSVEITCPIPTELLNNKDRIKIVCVDDGKLQILPTKIIQKDGVYCVVFTASHFSPYAFLVNNDIQVENIAAGAPIICNANPIYDNGLPYMIVLIGFTVFGIAYKLKNKAK